MQLPAVDVSQTEYDSIMSVFDDEATYQTWLLSTVRSEAIRRKSTILQEIANAGVREEVERFAEGLLPPPTTQSV